MAIFGKQTTGSGGSSLDDRIRGTIFSCIENGEAQSMTARLQSFPLGAKCKLAYYNKGSKALIGKTEERIGAGEGAAWQTFNFTAPKPQVSNIDFALCAHSDTAMAIDVAAVSVYRYFKDGTLVYEDYPDPWDGTEGIADYEYSIYLTYTPGVAKTIIRRPILMTLN